MRTIKNLIVIQLLFTNFRANNNAINFMNINNKFFLSRMNKYM